jgi:RNA polymerase sigma-70 factor (ECF subfamily)
MKGSLMERPPNTLPAGPEAGDKALDYASFDALYDRHKDMVFKYAYHLTQDPREAEDLFQETWLRVVRHFDKIRCAPERLQPWLAAIVSNLFKDSLRKKRVRRLVLADKASGPAAGREKASGSQAAPWPGPEKSAENAELAGRLKIAVAGLPERQRRVFLLKEVEGLKVEEISQLLEIPRGTVKSLGFRAVRGLRRELADPEIRKRKEPCDVGILKAY